MFIGHHRVSGEPVPLYKILAMEHHCQTKLDCFGGGWLEICEGWYVHIDGRLMFEPCSILNLRADEISDDMKAQLIELASHVAFELDQESVLVSWFRQEGEMHYVPPSSAPLVRNKSARVRIISREEKDAS